MVKKERLLSLDVMRGITVAAMILVNNSAGRSVTFAPLLHASWHGLTPTDLIYPFFMFIMGISMSFSLTKYEEGLTWAAFWKILKRSLLIFAVGTALHWFSALVWGFNSLALGTLKEGTTIWQIIFPLENFRIMGVLQGLAIAYFFGAIIVLTMRWRHILWVAGGLLAAYVVIMHLGHGYEKTQENIIGVIDRLVLGSKHLYQTTFADGTRGGFEPEGLLSNIPRIAHVIFGVYIGKLITDFKDNTERITRIFIFGTITLFSGLLLQYGDPINKQIWSSSFTLTTVGFGSQFLALLIWIIDMKGKKSWCKLFEVFGINPLSLYVVAWVASALMGIKYHIGDRIVNTKGWLFSDVLQPVLGDNFGSLAHALLFVAIAWLCGLVLYRKKIIIKL